VKKQSSIIWEDFVNAIKHEIYCNCVLNVGTMNFLQKNGIPMGGWISSFLQEIYCTYCEHIYFESKLEEMGAFWISQNVFIFEDEFIYIDFTRYKDNAYFVSNKHFVSKFVTFTQKMYNMPCKIEGVYPLFTPLNLSVTYNGRNIQSILLDTWSFATTEKFCFKVHKSPSRCWQIGAIHSIVQGALHRCMDYSISVQDKVGNVVNCMWNYHYTGTTGNDLYNELRFALKSSKSDLHIACTLAMWELQALWRNVLKLTYHPHI